MTENGTQIIEAAEVPGASIRLETAARHQCAARTGGSAGSLENTLRALTDHVAAGTQEDRASRHAWAWIWFRPRYQSAIKNVAIQLIRNAVMHGIETPAARSARANRRTARCDWNSSGLPTAASNCYSRTTAAASIRIRCAQTAIARGVVTRRGCGTACAIARRSS